MPGGVDIHAHIAGPKVNAARKLSPEERRDHPMDRTEMLRSGTGGLVPSTFATGYRYSLLGYTTVVEAAAPPLAARHVLSELRDTPMIDKAVPDPDGQQPGAVRADPVKSGERRSPQLRDAVAWWLEATGGYGVKLVNPGGVERWKQDNGNVHSLDDDVGGLRRDPAPGARGDRWRGGRARAAPSRPRPRQQPRRPGQRRHDARHDAHAVGPPGALRPPPVPLLRRRARGSSGRDRVPRARAARVPVATTRRSPPTSAR